MKSQNKTIAFMRYTFTYKNFASLFYGRLVMAED